MNGKTPLSDKAFIQRQRSALLKLREQLLSTTRAGEDEEGGIRSQSAHEAHEAEDDAQKLAMLEIDGTVIARNVERLRRVDRALQKIEDGTYGLSDVSGEPIPRDRLEAIPDAILTLSELKARELADDPRAIGTKKG